MSSSGSIPPRNGLIIAEAHLALLRIPYFPKDGVRLFIAGVTRARQRVYVIAAGATLARAATPPTPSTPLPRPATAFGLVLSLPTAQELPAQYSQGERLPKRSE